MDTNEKLLESKRLEFILKEKEDEIDEILEEMIEVLKELT